MAKQLGFFIDASKCTGCKTCQVACKDKNNLEVGRNFRRVVEYSGGSWQKDQLTGAWHTDTFAYYLSVSCNECSDPACVKACPYGAPQLDRRAGKMTKCDGCLDRLAKGMNPVCVDSCPMRAIEFGDIEDLMKKHPGCQKHIAPLPDPKMTQPNLLIKAPRNAKPVGDKSGKVYFPLKH